MDSSKLSKKLIKIALILLIIFVIALFSAGGVLFYNTLPVNVNDTKDIFFEVEKGWGKGKIITELKKQDLIKNELAFKIYLKFSDNSSFYAGKYKLSKAMTVEEIIAVLSNSRGALDDSISITFVEGKKFPYYLKKISENFSYTEEELLELTTNKEYLEKLIEKYWFLTNDILNDKLYYPLEGYIFADTYSFKKDSTKEEIIEKLLDGMDNKLSEYKEDITLGEKSVHSLLTMASMVELEAVSAEDRNTVAGVFYNRKNANMAMGSDVTTYYAYKKEMTDSLYMREINGCNPYNTRGTCAVLFPIGPIATPSFSSIVAAINPQQTEYLYFVADKNNKLYFSKTNEEQLKVISDLRKSGLWPEA